jgi:putative polymerase
VFIVFCSREDTTEQVRFTHAVCLYLALTLMVSFAFLSIKTAALLWFIYGALQNSSRRSTAHGAVALPHQNALRSGRNRWN